MERAPGHARRRVPPTSYLRVFEPLRAYDDAAQLRIAAQRGLGRAQIEEHAAEATLERVTRSISDPFPRAGEELYRVLHYPGADGLTAAYYCPDQLPVRATLASEQLDGTMRPQLRELLVPDAARAANASRITQESFVKGISALHTRGSTWGIPFGWFVLLGDEDHCEVEEEGDTIVTVRLSAPVVQALERARFAAASLAIHAPELEILDELTTISEWLRTFHTESIVELDYGPIAESVWPDESAQDLKLGIESLAEGDMLGAAAAYRRLTSRWMRVRQLARAS
jgi:hypothetical protein